MWDWDYALSILPRLLGALKVTLYATFWGFLLASVFGLLLAVLGRSRVKAIRMAVFGFVEFIRSTPLLVQLFFLFYSIPLLFGFSMTAFMTGVIGLGLHYSTYMSEVYRSGIDGVEKGQWEAARALNFSKARTWTSVVLPQALPPILPIMGNYLIVMFKETPLLAAITVVELLTTAKNINSMDWRPFEPYTIIGLLFLVISLLVSLLVGIMEKHLGKRHTR
ncbi:ectoine/hydroxyectoine ABC transporter permease subunit EhuD [Paenibacillus abyssi]|uniref:Ectoine/hydroxyectoine ABC transporter permease subunit EhuD n=1 Tax=Paenibacillus abyssi TaxID=1340531 RepID=A0A917CSQ4_9BACL|nr:ectoine/hydroxyectoine ABC transporter permease subunit EhuD [Paenibacillus abyssi]GGF96519.1 ectoine/hydroxyectoine ABC transporter permease subunit EhuD [Paenibacillus abyssi]